MTRQIPTRKGTKAFMIRELCEAGNTKRETFSELRPLVTAQIAPMIFSANVSGHREPKAISEQLIDLKNEIGRVYALLGRSANSSFESEEITAIEETEEEETKEEKPRAKGKNRISDELEKFLKRVREIRSFCERRAVQSDPVDSISMRPVQAASKLIPAGLSCDALLSAMTLHWPKDVRRDAEISDFNFSAFSSRIMSERGISEITRTHPVTGDSYSETAHDLFGYALILAECRQPIMLVGPAGTGKSHIASQLADFLGYRYGETPMSPGATRGDLLGRHTIGGFISAEFAEIYGGGGVFNFEEIDASDASMLIVLNNALASNQLYNSSSGEMVNRHEDFIAISTANTFGLGANREYTARERLDAATIDRWRMGRIWVPLDESVEESLLWKYAAK